MGHPSTFSIKYWQYFIRSLAFVLVLAPYSFGTAWAKRQVGYLQIESNIRGALVVVDGKRIARTPMRKKRLKVGRHKVVIKKLGYLAQKQIVRIKKNKTTKIFADLLPFKGVVSLTTRPSGASVYLGKKLLGKTPLLKEIESGIHLLVIKAKGRTPYTVKLQSTPGKTKKIKVQLKRRKKRVASPSLELLPLETPEAPGPKAKKRARGSEDAGLAELELELPPAYSSQDPVPQTTQQPLLPPLGGLDLPLELPLASVPQEDVQQTEDARSDIEQAPSQSDLVVEMMQRQELIDKQKASSRDSEWYKSWWFWGTTAALVSSSVVIGIVVSGEQSLPYEQVWAPCSPSCSTN